MVEAPQDVFGAIPADAQIGSVLKVEMAILDKQSKGIRLTNKPMTMSCICVVFEKQMVLRTKRLIRVRKVLYRTLLLSRFETNI
jgi:hypothetical protein